ATALNPRYIGGSRISIGDSLLYRRWNTCCPSLLFPSGESAAVREYHPTTHRCFA
ncbi:hypothetical protein HAX54_032083, partial [Datura stramonium]|nr:hypothetical protein [Datura stramonium]